MDKCNHMLTREEATKAIRDIEIAVRALSRSGSFVTTVRELQREYEERRDRSWRAAASIMAMGPFPKLSPRPSLPANSSWNRWQLERDAVGRQFCFHREGARGCCSRSADTRIFLIVGSGTVFDVKFEDHSAETRVNTIVLIEARETNLDWLQYGDVDLADLDRLGSVGSKFFKEYCSNYGDGFHVMFADGEITYLKNDVPYDVFRDFCRVETAQGLDRNKELGKFVIDKVKSPL